MDVKNFIDIEYIIVFIFLVVPGFLMMKIIRLKIPSKNFLLKDMLLEALFYSLLNLVLTGLLYYWLRINEQNVGYILGFIFCSVIVLPIILGLLYVKLTKFDFFMKHFNIQTPTAWDWYFSQRPNCILVISLKNGSEISGYFGSKSYATSYPNEESIYLESISENENLESDSTSDGIIISKSEISTIKFYKIKEK